MRALVIVCNMIFILNNQTNPSFNIALEEYLLKDSTQEIIMLYRNEPSIIIGKNQNALAEINFPWANKNRIPIIRRISGGGTVYHDLGNINFAFICNGQKNKLIDFERFTSPIISILQGMGLDAKFEGHNDIRLKGKKISGNAEHGYRSRIMHHGTLLFSSKLDDLRSALKVNGSYTDKAVASVPSSVTNIQDHLENNMSASEFMIALVKKLIDQEDCELAEISKSDKKAIQLLMDKKYNQWEWNLGASPNYTFHKGDIKFSVSKGTVTESSIKSMIGKRHRIEALEEELKEYTIEQLF